MQEDKIGNSRMVENGKKRRLARKYHTAVCPEGPADFLRKMWFQNLTQKTVVEKRGP